MANFITTKYGTRIDVTGLSPEQVARVKSVAEDKGAYGAKGAALAKQLQKQSKSGTNTQGDKRDLGVNKNTGQINPAEAVSDISEAAQGDVTKTILAQNPNYAGPDGSGQTTEIDPVTGQPKVSYAGGKNYTGAQGAFMNSLGSFGGPLNLSGAPQIDASGSGRQRAEDAVYGYLTKNYGRDKAREMEAAKQELANRGIPTDPSPNSLYGRTLQAIDEKYQGMEDQAKNQAITQGNQAFATDVGAQSTAYNAFLSGAQAKHGADITDVTTFGGLTSQFDPTKQFGPYQGTQSQEAPILADVMKTMSAADAQKYATDKDFRAKMNAIAASNKSSGGGGGGGGGGFSVAGSITE